MRAKEFLSKLEHDRIVQAIRDAESKTSGQIRVFIQRGKLNVDPLSAAQKRFHRLGMQKTPERNAVLIFVAPRAHKFAVIGDEGIHRKCGEDLWQRIVRQMREHFQNENFSDAIVDAIRETGDALAEQFPARSTSSGGLPDEVIES
ncbi:MAG TPA: TPM domain-containing protein [Chthoniobacterales bacterium]|nr:TPM domain-containing protein [Chthoniobacterales bacterium]